MGRLATTRSRCARPRASSRRLRRSHRYGQSPSIWRFRNAPTCSSITAQPADLALGHVAHLEGLDQVIHRAGGDALHMGFLDDGQSAPSRPCIGAPGARGSSYLGAAWGYSARRRPACPTHARGSRWLFSRSEVFSSWPAPQRASTSIPSGAARRYRLLSRRARQMP